MKYRWKGNKDRNRHKNRIKRSGQAQLVYVKDVNHNIPTTWRWACRDWCIEFEKNDKTSDWQIHLNNLLKQPDGGGGGRSKENGTCCCPLFVVLLLPEQFGNWPTKAIPLSHVQHWPQTTNLPCSSPSFYHPMSDAPLSSSTLLSPLPFRSFSQLKFRLQQGQPPHHYTDFYCFLYIKKLSGNEVHKKFISENKLLASIVMEPTTHWPTKKSHLWSVCKCSFKLLNLFTKMSVPPLDFLEGCILTHQSLLLQVTDLTENKKKSFTKENKLWNTRGVWLLMIFGP